MPQDVGGRTKKGPARSREDGQHLYAIHRPKATSEKCVEYIVEQLGAEIRDQCHGAATTQVATVRGCERATVARIC